MIVYNKERCVPLTDKFPYSIIAAPLAGISVRAYREIVRKYGADLAYGEMVSCRAIGYGNVKSFELLDIQGEEHPRMVQLCGCEEDFVRRGAELAVSLGADMLDLNMGCPVPKVVRNHEGSALMLNPELAAKLIVAAKSAGKPVSVKFRLGWDQAHMNAIEFAQMAEAAGASFVAVHGRTRDQFYGGKANWEMIARVKESVSIPVVGNGDVFSWQDALQMKKETHCDGIMVGRGMLGNPWLFREIKAAFAGEVIPPRPTPEQIIQEALGHLARHIDRCTYFLKQRPNPGPEPDALAEGIAIRAMRGHMGWYTKGLRNSAQLRLEINQLTTFQEIKALFSQYLTSLSGDASQLSQD